MQDKITDCRVCYAAYSARRTHCPYCGAAPLNGKLLPCLTVIQTNDGATDHVQHVSNVQTLRAHGAFNMK